VLSFYSLVPVFVQCIFFHVLKPQSKPQGDVDGCSKRRTRYIFNKMASKKRVTEPQTSVHPSQHKCLEHQVSSRHSEMSNNEVHVGDKDECREFGTKHKIFSAVREFVAHSNPIDVEAMIRKSITGTELSKRSRFRLSLVSDFSDAESAYESKIENEDGQFRLSFVSDLSDASGLSGIENYETNNVDDSSNDAQQEHSDTTCQVRYPFIAAFPDGSALNDYRREEQLLSDGINSTTSHPQPASSSFLPIELTSVQSIPHLRLSFMKSSYLSDHFSDRSVFSADFTVTGLFLDDASHTPDNVYQHCTHDSLVMSTYDSLPPPASVEVPEDDSVVTFSSQKLEDDSAVGICGPPLSSDDSATFNFHTKNARHDSSEQHPRRSASKAFLEAMVSMFKRSNGHRDECDLVVDLHDECSKKSEDGCIVKCRNARGFAFDFSAWEKRRK